MSHNTTTDPLLEQASSNRLTTEAPTASGSAPLSEGERAEGKAEESAQKNPMESKMEEVFDQETHQKEMGGAGVGTHVQH